MTNLESLKLEGPYYINLDHRNDRRILVENEFKKLNIDSFVRVPAIYTPNDGATGCLASHIKALETAPSDNDALWICEDDIEFKLDRYTLDSIILSFMASDAVVLCLGYNSRNEKEYSPLLKHTKDVQTASCYIVKSAFRPNLLNFWKSILEYRINRVVHPYKYIYMCLPIHKAEYEVCDQSWKVLQNFYIFVIPKKHYVIQRSSYSDIERRVVNYGV
jgi:GR25 family glycosyltransferase involved in LPS biosynthesis